MHRYVRCLSRLILSKAAWAKRLGSSTRKSTATPRSMSTAPMSATHLRFGPGPVNANFELEAVTPPFPAAEVGAAVVGLEPPEAAVVVVCGGALVVVVELVVVVLVVVVLVVVVVDVYVKLML